MVRSTAEPPEARSRTGLLLGLALFAGCLLTPAPAELGTAAWRTLAVALLMATWWVTEAIPIPATALLPLALFPVLGVAEMKAVASNYGHDLIFLQLGSFLLAIALERCGLHRRVALGIVARVGVSPARIVLGFMLASALLSMWISNTATTAMMLPIAIAAASLFRSDQGDASEGLATSLMLGIAFAASIGGISTLIGTPPNVVLAASTSSLLGREIGFLDWTLAVLPITCLLLPICWLLLTKWLYPAGPVRGDAAGMLAKQRSQLGSVSRTEWTVGAIFMATALAFVIRSEKVVAGVNIPGIQTFLPAVRDSTIAIIAALLLFIVPTNWRQGRYPLTWAAARELPWGVLLLFGGGLALADGMRTTGLAEWIGSSLVSLREAPTWVTLVAISAMFVFLTEVTSNMATATMAMPIMASVGVGMGVEPMTLMATAALSTSMAFMLPVATPPNAIVFGSGLITMRQMMRAGFFMNVLAIAVVSAAAAWTLPWLTR